VYIEPIHKIVEIHSVSPCTDNWAKRVSTELLRISMTISDWGNEEQITRVFSKSQWEEIEEQGYYNTAKTYAKEWKYL
jgi:hypothetical protein